MPATESDTPPAGRLWVGRSLAILLVLLVGAMLFFGMRLLQQRAETTRTVAPDASLANQCPNVKADILAAAQRIQLTGKGDFTLGGALVGPPTPGAVVLRQGASQTICDWLPWAAQTAKDTGVQVLLFDRRGRGSAPGDANVAAEPEDSAAAVAYLRAHGAQRVGLVASSMGNSVLYSALPDLPEPPCAVVSISPVLTAADDAGQVDGRALRDLVANTWVTWETKSEPVSANAAAITAAATKQGLAAPHTLPVDTTDHSRMLLGRHPEVADFVRQGVATCAAS